MKLTLGQSRKSAIYKMLQGEPCDFPLMLLNHENIVANLAKCVMPWADLIVLPSHEVQTNPT